MSFVKITELPAINETVLPLTAGDVMPIVHGDTTYQVKLSTLQEYFNLNIELSAAGRDGWVQVNDHGVLSAFGGLIFNDAVSGLQVGYDNILTGLYSSILGGASNTNNRTNTHIIGSNIQASVDDFTLVNNLSAKGLLYTGKTGNSIDWYQAFLYVDSNSARLAQPALDSRYVKLSGDIMTGSLRSNIDIRADQNLYAGQKLAINVDAVPGFDINTAQTGTIVGNLSVTGDIYGSISGAVMPDIANVLYVSTAGKDTNSGRNIFTPLRTIKKACQIVSQNQGLLFPVTDTVGVPTKQWTIFLDTGDYTEQNPIFVPQSTSIIGDNLRRVTVRPANRYYDIFWLNNACYVWGLTFRDHLQPAAGTAFPNLNSSLPQFQIAFNTSGYEIANVGTNNYYRTCKPLITTSPYTQGMSSITQAIVAPQQTGYVQVLSANTYLGLGTYSTIMNTASTVVDREFETWVTITIGGSATPVATSPTNLGARPGDYLTGISTLSSNRATIQSATIAYINATYPGFLTVPQQASCSRDTGYMIDSIIADLQTGTNARIVEAGNVYYVGTLNQYGSTPSPGPEVILPAIWTYVQGYVNSLLSSSPGAQTYVFNEFQDLIDILTYGSGAVPIDTLNTPTVDELRAANLMEANRTFFQTELTAYVDRNYPGWNYTETDPAQIAISRNKSYRDTGWLVDSIVYDLRNGTNARAVTYANAFWIGTSQNRLNGQQYVCVAQFNYAKYLASFVIKNQTAVTAWAGCGIRVDGSLVRGYLRSFVTDSYTQFNEGGAGLHITNNGYAQLVSTFTICCTVGVSADNGGTCSINTSNSSFGLSGLVANGYSVTPVLTGTLINNVQFNTDFFSVSGISPRNDAPDYSQWPVPVSAPYVGLVYTIQGDPTNTLYILASANQITSPAYTYNIISNQLTDDIILSGGTVNFYLRSQIWTGSHTFEYIGSGVILSEAIPALGGVANPDYEGRGVNGGAVFFTSTNHLGNFKVGNDFTIVQETGTIEGRTFQRSILALVTPLTLALE